MSTEIRMDLLMPAEMAHKAEEIGVRKAGMKFWPLFALAVLAGAFIGVGSLFASITAAGSATMPYGVTRTLMGLVFSIGLILVVIGGAELFTGNVLIVIAWASRKVSTLALLRNWAIVYFGNFVGGFATAGLVFLGKQYTFGSGVMGETALKIAVSKSNLGFVQAIALAILCNAMVCMAVWLTYSGRTTTDKILAILFPIAAFVAAGFEHSVANMYFLPYAWLIKSFDPAFVTATGLDVTSLTWGNFLLKNFLPVTIGNIIGGAGLVALMYWFIYLRTEKN